MSSAPAPAVSNVNVPNALTLLRVLMVPVFGWMLLAHPDEAGWRVASTVVFVLAIATDSLDGYLARRHDLITSFGKLADPIADKALTGMAFVGLSIIGELWWWVTVVILLREWGITVMRFVVLRYGVMAASRGGKLKTVLQAVALVLYLLPLSGWPDVVSVVAMVAALVVTVVTGVDYVLAAVRLRRQGRTA
ncbi:CDP-diacylglycerol--glycerol-3-phosphate 3-phosphatidyltransferase [Desertihabitans aurantiacus]|uniref:CDP-diacylglycerol--glycerol-3-phosphate 3-phosphatidyltransferase n=1 Tax=Desertihabitans aurantiacus TaxID=2282477 RepID=UPI0022B7F91B|nr:CDP-diacylglycerol--glycerol-3-phosphate 3-phosphatidyltransferase [Desertihabitans aurantiacus]